MSLLEPHVRTAVFPHTRVGSLAGVREMARFRRYVRRNRIDVIHSFMNRSAIFSALAAFRSGCPAVISSRLNTGYWYNAKYIRLFHLLDRFTSHVVTNSAFAKKVTADVERIAPEKITVLYPGVDLKRYARSAGDPAAAAALGIPADAEVIGIVANFRPVKDLALFLSAARVVAQAAPKAAFLLVGEGALKPELRQLACDFGIGDRVFFSDPGHPVPDYLARMSVACLSSKSEGLPNAILEYMAARLPVVTTDVGGVSELVTDGVTGYLVRERSAEAFAAPLLRLLRDSSLRTAMGERGLERARNDFDMTAAIHRLEEFYIDAASGVATRPFSPPATQPQYPRVALS